MRYGFVGLGHLGRHLAANLARGGFELGSGVLINVVAPERAAEELRAEVTTPV